METGVAEYNKQRPETTLSVSIPPRVCPRARTNRASRRLNTLARVVPASVHQRNEGIKIKTCTPSDGCTMYVREGELYGLHNGC
jgi:hypothetical protein